jgi:hypothetical protein
MDVAETISLSLLELLDEAELRCMIEDFNGKRVEFEQGD